MDPQPLIDRDFEPLIAVTGPRKRVPIAWWATRLILLSCGARPVHLVPGDSAKLVQRFDAIVIGGGDDIDASMYGDENHELAKPDPERDDFELSVLESALESEIPIMGICRGAQLINVIHGGNLYGSIRHLREKTRNARTPFPRKTAIVEQDSRLGRIMNPSSTPSQCYWINSLHHQAVKDLGAGLRVVARDLDGFPQAIESVGDLHIIGTQWHPEYLPYLQAQRHIFGSLIEAARMQRFRTSL